MKNLIRTSGRRLRTGAVRARPYLDMVPHYARHGWASTRAAHAIRSSGLFDLTHYQAQTPDPLADALDAIAHYLQGGAAAGLDPNPFFDTAWYLSAYPDVARDGRNPLVDFIENGVEKRRNPSERFDTAWYLSQNPDVAAAGIDPLRHYLKTGRHEGRAPTRAASLILASGLFNAGYYGLQTAEPLAGPLDAIAHYLQGGAAAGLNPNPFFDTAWYLSAYPDVARDGRNPLVDFIENGVEKRRNPSERFDTAWYLSQNPDVAAAGVNPLRHYLRFGHRGRRTPSPLIADPRLPVRFENLLSDLVPQDGQVAFQLRLDVQAVKASDRLAGLKEAEPGQAAAAAAGRQPFPPRPYIARFDDVAVIGGTRLVVPSASLGLSDEIAHFGSSPGWHVRPHAMILGADGRLTVNVQRRYPSVVERGVHLMHEYAGNYFHMVAEVLPRLVAAEEIGLDPDLPLLVEADLGPNLRGLIDCLNDGRRRVVELAKWHVYAVRELHYVSDVSSVQDVYERPRHADETVLHGPLIRQVADRVIGAFAAGPAAAPWRRLYLRRGRRYRGLQNEREIEEILLGYGFELVLMDDLSLAAQVRLFREAAVVVAPTGAAVTNILWCRPGTPVYVFAASHKAMPIEVWSQLAAVAGCEMTAVSCRRAYANDGLHSLHDDYSVDLAVVREIAERHR